MEQVIYAARASEAATERFDDLAAGALGINRTDTRCLNIVDNEGGSITAGRLAELSGLTTAAITAVLDRLEAKGYARRVRDVDDRRRVLVEVTPKMLERAEKIWGPLGADARTEFDRMSPDQLQTVIEFFNLSKALNERHIERVRELRFD